MKIYLLNKVITNPETIESFGVTEYKNLRFKNKTLEDYFKEVLEFEEFFQIDTLDQIRDPEHLDIMVISYEFFIKEKILFQNYIKFIKEAFLNIFIGEVDNSFIYKGNCGDFNDFDNWKSLVYRIPKPDLVINLGVFIELNKLITENPDKRHFNSLEKKQNIYKKTSLNKDKLKSEYSYLKNIESTLSHFYAEVYDYGEEGDTSFYTMRAYSFKDVSYQFLSKTLSSNDFSVIFDKLVEYFKESRVGHKIKSNTIDFDNLLIKNLSRFNELKSDSCLFNKLNKYMKLMFDHDLEYLFSSIDNHLKNNKEAYINAPTIISHGDLCFSNILFCKINKRIKLIDPRGIENKGLRSSYYDAAKFSHSYLGNYDLIINKKSDLSLNDNLKLEMKFDNGYSLNTQIFNDFIKDLNLDVKIVRLVEASLFLSMIVLHKEDSRKCILLCAQSFETFSQYTHKS